MRRTLLRVGEKFVYARKEDRGLGVEMLPGVQETADTEVSVRERRGAKSTGPGLPYQGQLFASFSFSAPSARCGRMRNCDCLICLESQAVQSFEWIGETAGSVADSG